MKGFWSFLILLIIGLFGIYLYSQSDPGFSLPILSPSKIFTPPKKAPGTSQPVSPELKVPILMYHYIRDIRDYPNPNDSLGRNLSVSPANFEHQLRQISQAGYKSISLIDFANNNLPAKPIILTFDDGYADFYYNAFPLLKKFDFTATVFIVKDFIGRPGYLNNQQIDILRENQIEIGSHSSAHRNLTRLDYEALVQDISASLKNRSPVFSYPAGQYNEMTLDVLSALSVKAAVTTKTALAKPIDNKLELPRIRVKNQTDILQTISRIEKITAPIIDNETSQDYNF